MAYPAPGARTRSTALLRSLSPFAAIAALSVAPAAAQTVFVNEIHYDNTSTDAGEAIEVAAPGGTDLSGWSLVLYNGSGGAPYNTLALSGIVPVQQGGFGVLSFPAVGLQNGAPDGLALVQPDGTVAEFLSYEGVLTATNGPAAGQTSVDIGVSEPGTDPAIVFAALRAAKDKFS